MEKQQWVIRPMELKDVDQVHTIETQVFTLPWTKGAFLQELTQNQMAAYFVLVNGSDGNEIVGYVGTWKVVDEAHITTIAVAKRYQGKGLGGMLLERAMVEMIAVGVVRMTLEVRISNVRALSMYRQYGFKEAGIRKRYYSDNQEDAIIMWAELNGDE